MGDKINEWAPRRNDKPNFELCDDNGVKYIDSTTVLAEDRIRK